MEKIHNRPLIGITLDSEDPGGYSNMPWYALRKNYSQSITQAGGLAIALPHEPENADLYLDKIDGLVITGGAFDVDPIVFGSSQRHHSITTKDERTKFELAITRRSNSSGYSYIGYLRWTAIITRCSRWNFDSTYT